MIRGIVGVVPSRAAKVGRFYLSPSYERRNRLFQCVDTSADVDGIPVLKALVFKIGDGCNIGLESLPDNDSFVELSNVHIRIDPNSLSGSHRSISPGPKRFLVDGQIPIIYAPTDNVGNWCRFNLLTGVRHSESEGFDWLSFDRWSLVLDDETGEEMVIAEFGAETSSD